VQVVRRAPAKHADETGWERHGRKCRLWVAATTRVAALVVNPGRGLAGLAVLPSADFADIVVSDRWAAYQHLPVYRRPLGWDHLRGVFRIWWNWVGLSGPTSSICGP
jgi:hypothetical protein